MEDHQHLQLLGLGPNRVEAPIVEVPSPHIGVDLEPVEAEVGLDPRHLGDRRFRMVHGQVGDADEPVGSLLGHGEDGVVLQGVDPGAGLLVEPVEVLGWGDGQGLHIDALEVHVGEPGGGVDELVGLGRPQLPVVPGALLGLDLHPRVVLGAEQRCGDSRRRRHLDMGVDVDGGV
jgi:hypothetical protein